MKRIDKNIDKIAIGMLIITLIAVLYIAKDEERFAVMKKDFSTPIFVGIFVLIIIFSIIGLNMKGKMKNATIHAIIAFITAYLAHLNMAFAVFFIVGLFVYYSSENISA